MNVATRASRPTTLEDLHRLAALAQERGLRVFEPAPNRWVCTSASSPWTLYIVTGFSCTCPGFAHHGRCTHHSLLLATLGWLPSPEPEPAPACRECGGAGIVYVAECEAAGFPHPRCPACGGSGRVSVEVVAA